MSTDQNNHRWEIIRWHAGMVFDIDFENIHNQTPLFEAIWKIKKGELADLKSPTKHLMSEIQKANLFINGAPPSETVASLTGIPRQLACAISLLITECLEASASGHMPEQCRVTAWELSCAWDAILAGDIDSVCDHVELEGSVRGII